MRLVSIMLALPLFLLVQSSSLAHARTTSTSLRINEIMAGPARDWDGSGAFSSRDDEWVEIKNNAPGDIDLSGYFLSDGDSIPRYAFTGTLATQARAVVYGRDSHAWEVATGHPAFGLSLGNSGDAVILWLVANGETLVVDSYTYKSHEAAADRSVGRFEDSGEWSLFDGLNPYTGATPPLGNRCEPSPGAANVCAITPVRPTTWGNLKVRYR